MSKDKRFNKWIVEHTAGHPQAKRRRVLAKAKPISEISQPMTAWEVAVHLFGFAALDADYLLTGKAAEMMGADAWTFLEYDPVNGEEIWQPPIR